jgi:hypothetical protein
VRGRSEAAGSESPGKQLSGFISRFDPAIAKTVRTARTLLRKRFPTAVELVYDNYNALALGWGPTERASDVIVSVAAYANGVSLYFTRGATLPDPEGILEGNGTQGRFLRIHDSRVLETRAVKGLLRAAVQQAKAPLPRSGKTYTVIKSVSLKQKARRPTRN